MKTKLKDLDLKEIIRSSTDKPVMIARKSTKEQKAVDICELEMADIILVHTKRSLWSWLIRVGTHSYWNHAMIVCNPGNSRKSYENAVIVDPKTDGSIRADYLSKYTKQRGKYDIAIVRLEAPWFRNNQQADKRDIRSRICKIAIDEVITKKSSKLKEIVNQGIRQATVILRFIRRRIRRHEKPLSLSWSAHPTHMKAFTCGGFVQWCYYKVVAGETRETSVKPARLKDVLFNMKSKKRITPFELLTTTPADLANCNKLSWKYVIKDRAVWQVSNKVEAQLVTELA